MGRARASNARSESDEVNSTLQLYYFRVFGNRLRRSRLPFKLWRSQNQVQAISVVHGYRVIHSHPLQAMASSKMLVKKLLNKHNAKLENSPFKPDS